MLQIKKHWIYIAGGVGVLLVFIYGVYFWGVRPPKNFPDMAIISVSDGESLTAIARDLKEKNVIRSPFWFTNFIFFLKHERKVISGDYYFDQPVSSYEVAKRLANGTFSIKQIKTTIPEGANVKEIAEIIASKYPSFDKRKFIEIASKYEGRLFPETYKFGANPRPEHVVDIMKDTFEEKVLKNEQLQQEIKDFGKSFDDVLKMASIVEGEARQMKTRQMISGILWKRIEKNMPLQVDVSLKYLIGKGTDTITRADLKIDSPYNSYVYKGLPPTPISNPGIDAIKATITPIKTNYLYFLTDRQGVMHYSATYEDHSWYQDIYLR